MGGKGEEKRVENEKGGKDPHQVWKETDAYG